MKPLFHFADLWKCFVKLFKNVDRVATEDGEVLLAEDNVVVDGNLAFSGDMFPGQDSKVYGFDNIVDKDGNKRFVEGDITIETIEGVTKDYGKWSLSGSHLMIVLAISIANGTVITNNSPLSYFELPGYIFDKIKPIFSGVTDMKSLYAYASDFSQQSFTIVLNKDSNPNRMRIRTGLNPTLTADRSMRIQFDLLIDNA